jgi:hypothetical protein
MQKLITFVVLSVAAGLFAYQSFIPIYRLRPVMPPEFMDAPSSWPPEKRAAEESLARAYWDCAVNVIQWRYGYGYRLPQDPPSDFIISSLGEAPADPVIRARYWLMLQRVWYVPDNWTKSYRWDTRWLTDWVESLRNLSVSPSVN